MQTREKRLIIIVCVLLIIFALTFTFMNKSKSNNINNEDDGYVVSSALNKEYELDGLKISDLELYSSNNKTKFSCKVTNTTDHILNIDKLAINMYDKDDKLFVYQIILFNTSLATNDNQYASFYGDMELSEIKNIEFEVTYAE